MSVRRVKEKDIGCQRQRRNDSLKKVSDDIDIFICSTMPHNAFIMTQNHWNRVITAITISFLDWTLPPPRLGCFRQEQLPRLLDAGDFFWMGRCWIAIAEMRRPLLLQLVVVGLLSVKLWSILCMSKIDVPKRVGQNRRDALLSKMEMVKAKMNLNNWSFSGWVGQSFEKDLD